jgi:hypothetical protein
MKINPIKILLALIVFSIIIIQNFLFPQGWAVIIVGGFVIIIFYLADSMIDFYNSYRDKRDQEKILQGYYDDFLNICDKLKLKTRFTNFQLRSFFPLNSPLSKEVFYRIFIDKGLSKNLTEEDKRIIYVIFLCFEIDNIKDDILKDNYKKNIDISLKNFNLIGFDKYSKLLLHTYFNYKNKMELSFINPNLDYNSIIKEFTQKYSHNLYSYILLKNQAQAEEFRKTLSFLLNKGKLNSLLIKNKIDKILISTTLTNTKGFILLANKFHKIKTVQDSLNKYPQLVFTGGRKPINFPESSRFLHIRILYPKVSISPKYFLDHEILGHIPKDQKNIGFAAIIPFETSQMAFYPSSINDLTSEYMKESYGILKFFETGSSTEILNEAIITKLSEIGLSEILSIIPFNIFIPNEPERIKLFIIESYEKIQNHFNIQTLFDWANIDPQDLTMKFIEYGCLSIDPQEKKWAGIAQKIVKEATKHQQASR